MHFASLIYKFARPLLFLTIIVVLIALGSATSQERGDSRIVNGITTHDYPTTGALLYNPGTGVVGFCSGTLIGCDTFITAAHCVEGDLNASNYSVFLQHAGNVSVTSVTQHPTYVDANFSIADVAVLKLGSQVTGIDPTEINQTDPSPYVPGAPGTIAGFGVTLGSGKDKQAFFLRDSAGSITVHSVKSGSIQRGNQAAGAGAVRLGGARGWRGRDAGRRVAAGWGWELAWTTRPCLRGDRACSLVEVRDREAGSGAPAPRGRSGSGSGQ